MVRGFVSCVFVVASLNASAENIVDVYGLDFAQSEKIIKNHGVQVAKLEEQLFKEIVKLSNGGKGDYVETVLLPQKDQLIKKIQTQYDLAYVEFDVIFYPNNKNIYTTIEVISKNDKASLHFIPQKGKQHSIIKSKYDLIDNMTEFVDAGMKLMLNHQLGTKEADCPVYHCLPGFNHPNLRNDFNQFVRSSSKQKELLLKTLNNDPTPQRRIAAAYLIGYLNNPREIISLLIKHVTDSDDGVRNSTMRVISATMKKSKIVDINVSPFIALLDSPFDTDRNKALLILVSAAKADSSKRLIIRYAPKQLISLLRLNQPNNHDVSYQILKKISGKNFGPYDITAWEKWLGTYKV